MYINVGGRQGFRFRRINHVHKSLLSGSNASNDLQDDIVRFQPSTAVEIIVTQASLIPLSIISGAALKIPSFELNFIAHDFHFIQTLIASFNTPNIIHGILATAPLLIVALFLDLFEQYSPSLQAVTNASLRSVMTLLGTSKKPVIAIFVSLLLGIAAGFGEEMMFRGVLQSEIVSLLHPYSNLLLNTKPFLGIEADEFMAITASALLFGALHMVTFLYAAIATIAGIYFGYLQAIYDHTLTIPIIAHAVYDWIALVYAHWVVTNMTRKEQLDLLDM
jgi:membrane protease YdiL (CAAX protease family)